MMANKPETHWPIGSVSAAPYISFLCTHLIVGYLWTIRECLTSESLFPVSWQNTLFSSRYSDLEGCYHLVRVNYYVLKIHENAVIVCTCMYPWECNYIVVVLYKIWTCVWYIGAHAHTVFCACTHPSITILFVGFCLATKVLFFFIGKSPAAGWMYV